MPIKNYNIKFLFSLTISNAVIGWLVENEDLEIMLECATEIESFHSNNCMDLLGKILESSSSTIELSRCSMWCYSKIFLEVNLSQWKCMLIMQMFLDSMSNSNCYVTVTLVRWQPRTTFYNIVLWSDSNTGLQHCYDVWSDFDLSTNVHTTFCRSCYRVVVWSDFNIGHQHWYNVVVTLLW